MSHEMKLSLLKKYFGYDAFLPLQAEIVDAVLAKQDSLVLMPTGGGKSLCFQLPALMLGGLCLVVSPLIALMKDQIESLRANGIAADALNSTLTAPEAHEVMQRCREGITQFLYLAPERLSNPGFLRSLADLNVSLIAIDEAHCISSWGHDFRPEYQKLKLLRQALPHVPVIALTATADRAIRKDILKQLQMPAARVFLASFDRPNLSLTVMPGQKRLQQILKFLRQRPDQAGIIYCLSRKSTEKLARDLSLQGYKAGYYHAGLEPEIRASTQDAFLKDELKIVCATIAFGMGIDKSNVRWVIHYNPPKNLENYYQEIGRAGRDRLPAETLLFYSYADIRMHQEMLEDCLPERRELLQTKLWRLQQYAESETCRRRILLSYFNELTTGDCGNCDICLHPPQRFDGSVLAQKILSAVVRTQQSANLTHLIAILRGTSSRTLIERGWQQLPTFGIGKDISYADWEHYLLQLLNAGYLELAYDDGFTFKLTALSRAVLKGETSVLLVKPTPYAERLATRQPQMSDAIAVDEALLTQLRQLRKKLAQDQRVPGYIIFNDKTLSEMSGLKPTTKADMLRISGVGEHKFSAYGEAFLKLIADYLESSADVQTPVLSQKDETSPQDPEAWPDILVQLEGLNKAWALPSDKMIRSNLERGLPVRSYTPWNEHELSELATLSQVQGQSPEQLAEYFQRHLGGIRGRLRKLERLETVLEKAA